MTDLNESEQTEGSGNPTEEKSCFIISPIGEEGTQIRKRSDQVLRHVITPALIDTGFSEENIKRADKISEPGNITYQIIDYIIGADLVIADLSERNANVFYELAIRHALRKPYIQICDVNTDLPFDIQSLRTIMFDYRDLDSAQNAKEQIIASIKSLNQEDGNLMTPIHEGLEIHDLIQSEKPIEQALGNLYTIVNQLNEKIDRLEHKNKEKIYHIPSSSRVSFEEIPDARNRKMHYSGHGKSLLELQYEKHKKDAEN